MGLIRALFLIIHIIVVALMCGTLLNAYVPPKIFGYLNMLSLGFPVLMTVHFCLTLFWILTWKKRAIVFLLISLVFFNPVRRWINYTPDSGKEGSLKIISFNTKNHAYAKHKKEDELFKFMDKENADVVLFQENRFEGEHPGYLQYPIVALKTRHKLLKHGNIIETAANGNAFYADIEIHGKIIRFINVYLEPFMLEKSMVRPTADADLNTVKAKNLIRRLVPTFKLHQEQIVYIRKAVKESPYPVILTGDFNSVPNSWEYYHLSEGLQDAFVVAGTGSATSFHDYKFPIRIDYIFSSKEIKPRSYKVDRSVKLSDHFPVIATFDF